MKKKAAEVTPQLGRAVRAYRVHPNLLAHLSADMAQPLHTIHALRLQTAVTKHAQHLGVLCGGREQNSEEIGQIAAARAPGRTLAIHHLDGQRLTYPGHPP